MNTRKIFSISAAFLLTGLLLSCASSNESVQAPAPEPAMAAFGIEKGSTTKVEVLALLGPPDEARQVRQQEAWWYSPQTRKARDPHAHPGGASSSGAAGAVGKSMAMGGIGVLLGQLIPGGSNLGGAVASGMARSGIMSAGSQAISKGGEAMRAKDEKTARQTLVVLFEGDVVHDYAFAEAEHFAAPAVGEESAAKDAEEENEDAAK